MRSPVPSRTRSSRPRRDVRRRSSPARRSDRWHPRRPATGSPPVAGRSCARSSSRSRRTRAGHRGVDFAAPAGAAVRAANDGVVTFAGRVAGALHVVVAHDGGIRTSYSFLASVDVRVGEHGRARPGRRARRRRRRGSRRAASCTSACAWASATSTRCSCSARATSPRSCASSPPRSARPRATPTRPRSAGSCQRRLAERARRCACALCGADATGSPTAPGRRSTPASTCSPTCGAVGGVSANALDEGLHVTLHAIFAVADAARAALLVDADRTPPQDVVAGARPSSAGSAASCDEDAPPAERRGRLRQRRRRRRGHRLPSRGAATTAASTLPLDAPRVRAIGAVLVLVSPGVHRLLEAGHVRRSAPQGADARGAAQAGRAEQPGRDLRSHGALARRGRGRAVPRGGLPRARGRVPADRERRDVRFAVARNPLCGTTGEHLGRDPIGRALMRDSARPTSRSPSRPRRRSASSPRTPT